MPNARERRREQRSTLHVPPPEPLIRWLSTKALHKGRKQEVNLASVRYVLLSWVKSKGYCVEWNHKRFWIGGQERLSSREYRAHINDARKLFTEKVRAQAIEFALHTLELDQV